MRKVKRSFFYRAIGDSPFKLLFVNLALVIVCLVILWPVSRVITISLRPLDTLFSTDLRIIPEGATLKAYYRILFEIDFFNWLKNSLVIAFITAFMGVSLASTSAYAFSRFKFSLKQPGLVFLLVTQMFPAAMMLLPLYIMLIRLQLINTYIGLVIAYTSTALPFCIWILKGYYDTIPPDLEESARVDGATPLQAFYKIILPLSTPALAITFLFSFMTAWSEYLVARVVIQKSSLYTWTIGLYTLQGQYQTEWGTFAAASLLVSIPVVVIFLFTAKYLVSGLTLGAVKG